MFVTKRDGRREELQIEKFHKVAAFACEGLAGVSVSELELQTGLRFYDGITTSGIQETLIKAAADLISEDAPNYQYVASRLISYHLRKQIWQGIEMPTLLEHIRTEVAGGRYTSEFFEFYSENEITAISDILDHDRDYDICFAGMEQFRGKYLVRNRVSGQLYETPQFVFIAIAMLLFRNYPDRMTWIKDFYDALSTFQISMPTPVLAGLRTPVKQFSSCVLIESDDSLDSIIATSGAIIKYVAKRAGIGIGGGRIRAVGSKIRNGDATSTGCFPFYRLWQDAVNSCSQGSVRKGSATLNYPIWHKEVEDLLVLKNNKGTEENRLRNLDYCVQLNRVMYERLLSDDYITLFSPNDVPGLYDSFFEDVEEFKTIYEAAEKNKNIPCKRVKALELFSTLMYERQSTGRIYVMNVDHCNMHGSFDPEVAPIRMTNLCVEVTLPTKPLENIDDPNGEIALCTLGAVNLGKIRHPDDFKKPCELLVRGLDELLDYQDYLLPAAKNATMNRRPLGIGLTNLAYWLAKNNIKYSDPSPDDLQKVHEYIEAWSYYLIKASADLAKEPSKWMPLLHDTKYSVGTVPIDTYKAAIDTIVRPEYKMPWDELRLQLADTGIRNSTLMSCMPSETSAQVTNSTNGVEPPRALVSIKGSGEGVLRQVVPEVRRLKNKYDLLWDQKSPVGYIKIMAVLQKFIDQSISTNMSYNPKFFEKGEIPMTTLLADMVGAYRLGIKTLYYHNVNDGAGEVETEECEGCAI